MGKALVIKGANFSVNSFAQDSFTDPIPCTSLSLSASTLAMTMTGSTATLTAAVTPSNTTDAVTWATSNANIATVSNGVITQHGVGSVTITATCGNFSATCTVTCTVVYNANADLLRIANAAGYRPSQAADFLRFQTPANGYLQYINKGAYGDYPAFFNQSSVPSAYQGKGAIPLPYGATKINFTNPDSSVFDRLMLYFLNSNVAAESSNTHDSAKLILDLSGYDQGYIDIAGKASHEVNLSSLSIGASDEFAVTFLDTGAAVLGDTLNSTITIS